MAFRAATAAGSGGSQTTVTINKPSGVVDGDVLILSTRARDTDTVTWPAGWTEFVAAGDFDSTSKIRAAWKVASSEPASWDVTFPSGNYQCVMCGAWSGRSATQSMAEQATVNASWDNTMPLNLNLTGVTAASGDDIAVFIAIAPNDGAGDWDTGLVPTNYSEPAVSPYNNTYGVGALWYRDNVSAGATGTIAGEISSAIAGAQWGAFVVALAAASDPPSTDDPITYCYPVYEDA